MIYYEWIAVIDERTCNECLVRHGRIFSEKQLDKSGRPPLHSMKNQHLENCRCYLVIKSKKISGK